MQKVNYVNQNNQNNQNNQYGYQNNQNRMNNSNNMDFYSIMSTLQSALIQRQMEFQDWISDKFGIKNPTLKMLLCLVVMFPRQSFSRSKDFTQQMYHFITLILMHIKSIIIRKPAPNKIEVKIPSIHENSINYLFKAVDWFIKNNKQIKTDTNTTILILQDDITTKDFNREFSVCFPQQATNIITYNNIEYSFTKASEQVVINTIDGEMRKTNLIITIWSYYTTKEKLDELIKYITQQYAIHKSQNIWKQNTFTHHENMWNAKDNNKNMRKIESVVLNNNVNKKLKEDLANFTNTEQWHLEHGIPYKKSYLFYGPPGTGKTSMIKAISHEFQRHIHYMSLNMIKDDTQLNSLMSQIKMSETIIVIEDIDAMTKVVLERQNGQNGQNGQNESEKQSKSPSQPNTNEENIQIMKKNERPGITLSGLLNAIDGIHNNHGMILIMTSIMPDKLDKALLREGRVDDKIYFGTCDNLTIYNIMKNFYNGKIIMTEKEFIKLNFPNNITPCRVENIMKKCWNNYEKAIEMLINGTETELEKFTY